MSELKICPICGKYVLPEGKKIEEAGFSLKEHLLFKLPTKSFWRILEMKKWEKEGRKYPEELSFEHILIFVKATEK